ncbi:Alpha/Beta hydrolase protein [Microdochium bolleyi]|uniref:Carboxylic ester hydrolase n=1 Tax=Microdochium bolleyi TaxID=196109 RepID=A0A136ILH4_9PEZI|nr:Alpha/Beta hydrolase protein [Microdochium bolleyi]
MAATLEHQSLGCTVQGVHDQNTGVVQFRGIPYGNVSRRFGPARPATPSSGVLDCTEFGPRCPQAHVDVGHLLRIPQHHVLPPEAEDEFACLNLDVCVSEAHVSLDRTGRKLPVLIWIHGGSQAMTFGSAASKLCDMSKIVSDSARLGEPIITVAVQYRLNVFAHGDGKGLRNLALLDQALAIEWVNTHIGGFGGDPENITIAGESAGAVYSHAHLVAGAHSGIRQSILMSGSLYLSPPQPRSVITALRQRVADELGKAGSELTLESAPAEHVVEALTRANIPSWFLEEDTTLDGWRDRRLGQRLLVSDVQFESVIWRHGMWSASAASIICAFDLVQPEHHREQLKKLYGIHPDRPSSCKIGALDFMNDYKFVLPAEILVGRYECAGSTPALRCLIDEPNPWQPSHGAHHAVDLLLLFGGLEDVESYAPGATRAGEKLREHFIRFVNGSDPWKRGQVAAFGPYGMYQELDGDGEEMHMRRRMRNLDLLREIEAVVLDRVFLELARGRISLLN